MDSQTTAPDGLLKDEAVLAETNRMERDVEFLRDRLAKIGAAFMRIHSSLETDAVLQAIIDSCCLLTDARYGAILTFDESGKAEKFVTCGISAEEQRQMGRLPMGQGLLAHMSETEGTLRLSDIADYPKSVGFPDNHPPMKSFLGAPLRREDRHLGNIYLARSEEGGTFTAEDEEALQTFIPHVMASIVNSRAYEKERCVRADLETLLDTSPVGVLVYDMKASELVSLNPEARRIVHGLQVPGYSQRELLSVMTLRRPNGQDIPQSELATERAFRSGETVRADEMVIHLPDGKSIPVLCSAAPIRSEDGEIVKVVSTLQDMTPLEDLDRLRSEFLDVVAQELRNPLTSIKGAVATVLNSASSVDPVDARQYFRIVDQQIDQMSALIGSLVDVARVETGMLSLNTGPVDVSDLLEEAKRTCLTRGMRNTITIHVPQRPPPVIADRRRILQVLVNLFSNASKHSPDWSEITVRASVDEFYAVISVADKGAGIAPEDMPRIFRKHSRMEPEGTSGAGAYDSLALLICRGIIETHGGRIWADSEGVGMGAKFSFTIPVGDEQRAHRAMPSPSRISSPDSHREKGAQGRVLAVDSDQQGLRLVRSSLLDAGYVSMTTSDPSEAIHLAKSERPDLVLLGRTLDVAEGVELIKGVQEVSDIPIIVLLDHDEDEFVARAFEAGAEDYIVKPFSHKELAARIKAVLSKRTALVRTRTGESFALGDLTIDYMSNSVSLGGRLIQLTPTEYRLLCEFSMNAGRLLSYDHLLRRIWSSDDSSDTQVVRTFVKNLRHKLGDSARSPTYILTVPLTGYRMPHP